MTRIDAVVIVPASGGDVWAALTDHARWPEWPAGGAGAAPSAESMGGAANDGPARLTHVAPLADPLDRVGARRRCTATLPPAPLVGPREVSWTEVVADVRVPWTLELEAARIGRLLRRWRIRLTLVEQPDGQTRLLCRTTYAPASPLGWLADQLYVRRTVAAAIEAALAGLAASFAADAPSAQEPPTPEAAPAPVSAAAAVAWVA